MPSMNNFRQLTLLLCLAVVAAVFACRSSSSMDKGHDEQLEKQIINAIMVAKRAAQPSAVIDIPASRLLGKICFQGPYMNKSDFEAQVGRKVDTYDPSLDDVYVWWVFDDQNYSSWARIPRVAVADKDSLTRNSCFSLKDWKPELQCNTDCKYSMRKI